MSVLTRREHFVSALGFDLDGFQELSFDSIDSGHNTLVSAPTGSGKTLIATYAIDVQMEIGSRSFYTTPLKALSNQKYHELVARYGLSKVGLLTGDTSINRNASVVVMTTEVLRNMLLTESSHINELGLVILDEVHFLQDPFRGGVWEEVLVLTPRSVRFVALSATVANASTLGEWMTEVRGRTDVIVETNRPISLHNHVAFVKRDDQSPTLIDLLDDNKLSSESRRIESIIKSSRKFRPGPKWRGSHSSAPPLPFRSPRRSELISTMWDVDLLPAIVFIFSRAACDDAVRQVRRDGLRFTSSEDCDRIRHIAAFKVVDFSSEDLQALEFDEFLDALERGIAAHHAGMVPAFRETVEACFEQNLLGVVFATETLALGVNMPARSVVLEQFSKFSNSGKKELTSGEFAQLTGRAGRRGLDDEGHAVICFSPSVSLFDVARVAISPPPDLHSSFSPTYNLTANLVHQFDFETSVEILNRSYAQFEANRRVSTTRRTLSDQMVARHNVLIDLGYASGWQLTIEGQQLRMLYHESDLLICEAMRAGALDDAEPAVVAAILSAFVFEMRRTKKSGPHRTTPRRRQQTRNDRLGDNRRTNIRDRLASLRSTTARVFETEHLYGVPHARDPDGGFATTIAAWVRGAPLATVLEISEVESGMLSPGDFVRMAKQVADLCEQISRLNLSESSAAAAEHARSQIIRSVVARSAVIPLSDDRAI